MNNAEFSEIVIPMPWGHVAGRWYGNQNQRPLLALHGFMDNCGSFARLAPLLQNYRSLMCIDLAGHGQSSHLPIGIFYTILEYVGIILRLMKTYKWDKISLLGHSMGVNLAYIFTALYPDRVDMLICLDSIALPVFETEIMPQMIRNTFERGLDYNERLLQRQQAASFDDPPNCYTYAECERFWYEAVEHTVALENCKYILERNLRSSLKYPNKFYFAHDHRLKLNGHLYASLDLLKEMAARICRSDIPYLLVLGRNSKYNDDKNLWKIIEFLKLKNSNFELHTLTDATHYLHLNNAEEVAELILNFWKRKNLMIQSKEDDDLNTIKMKPAKSKL